jgi:peptidylprolyl isomerase
MPEAKNGDTVKVHYTGKLEGGTVFDTSVSRDPSRDPLEFTIGAGSVITGFEQAVIGMNPGESKTIEIPADKAYGPHHEEMVVVVNRNELPPGLKLKVGQRLQVRPSEGQTLEVSVTDVSELSVTLDGNHPLAGKDLTFDIHLVEIV